MGVTNQEFISRAALGQQPGPEEHDPRNDVLASAKRVEEHKHRKDDAICAAAGSILYTFRAREDGRVYVSVYILALALHQATPYDCELRDSALPADVLFGKLNRDNSFALRRLTVALGCPSDYTSRP